MGSLISVPAALAMTGSINLPSYDISSKINDLLDHVRISLARSDAVMDGLRRHVDGPEASTDRLIAQARRHMELGDVISARDLLASSDWVKERRIAFALAETYDPNMLAAWNIRNGGPDAHIARAIYDRALRLGQVEAKRRLHWLQ
ncbi:MAG: hypothetical protein NW223_06270 [Hyphomicrobiaceae bacterium]|nr:hypothetical protein [Hyphomicrobiaceae bacterium]